MTDTPKQAGYTQIRTRALERLAQYVASDVLDVNPREVDSQLRDCDARLGVILTSGIRDTVLESCANRTDTTLFTYADRAAKTFTEKMSKLSGYSIGDVDIHFTHIVDTAQRKRRVR